MTTEQIYNCLVSKPIISIGYIDTGLGFSINGWFLIAAVEFVLIVIGLIAAILTENNYKRALNNQEHQAPAGDNAP